MFGDKERAVATWAETMGHFSFRVTMDTYAHLVQSRRDIAVNRIAEIVLNAPKLEPANEANESGDKTVATAISGS